MPCQSEWFLGLISYPTTGDLSGQSLSNSSRKSLRRMKQSACVANRYSVRQSENPKSIAIAGKSDGCITPFSLIECTSMLSQRSDSILAYSSGVLPVSMTMMYGFSVCRFSNLMPILSCSNVSRHGITAVTLYSQGFFSQLPSQGRCPGNIPRKGAKSVFMLHCSTWLWTSSRYSFGYWKSPTYQNTTDNCGQLISLRIRCTRRKLLAT